MSECCDNPQEHKGALVIGASGAQNRWATPRIFDGPEVISGGLATDDRGTLRFVNDFNFSSVKRFYQVENHQVGFVRAWHGHNREGKYVYCVRGSALIGVVGLGEEGADKVKKFTLSASQPRILFIPPGFANGFKTLEAGTTLMFFSTSTLEESKGDDIRFPYDKWDVWSEDYR